MKENAAEKYTIRKKALHYEVEWWTILFNLAERHTLCMNGDIKNERFDCIRSKNYESLIQNYDLDRMLIALDDRIHWIQLYFRFTDSRIWLSLFVKLYFILCVKEK